MHRCLQIPEIICLLCDALEVVAGWPPDREYLNMALSCRAFLDPALNKLWKSISNLDPIISCLPRKLWKRITDDGSPGADYYHPVTTLVRKLDFITFS